MSLADYFEGLREETFIPSPEELQLYEDTSLIEAANKRPLVLHEGNDLDCSRYLRVYTSKELEAIERLADGFFKKFLS